LTAADDIMAYLDDDETAADDAATRPAVATLRTAAEANIAFPW
jgi:hypothetical protein